MESKNRFINTINILILLFLLIFSASILSFGQELTGEEIINKVNELMNQDTVQSKVKKTIITTSGEDTGARDAFIEDFSSKTLGSEKKEGYDCYKVEMLKKEGIESGYSRLIMWIIKNSFIPITIDYYDAENPELLLKTLIQYDIKEIDGIPTATKMVMYNKLENSQTSIEMLEIKYNVELDDSLFTERNLQRR